MLQDRSSGGYEEIVKFLVSSFYQERRQLESVEERFLYVPRKAGAGLRAEIEYNPSRNQLRSVFSELRFFWVDVKVSSAEEPKSGLFGYVVERGFTVFG